jgi:hypothetical protein
VRVSGYSWLPAGRPGPQPRLQCRSTSGATLQWLLTYRRRR